jgi:folate-dependent phosphoribosylglycinamide formyltransferase PurN
MNTSILLIKSVNKPRAKILFLGYSEKRTVIINELINRKCEVWHTEEKIFSIKNFDLIISYGYKHILNKEVIESSSAPIINLHISYLPWNRGAHPNFWSFFDGTPSGVTIHLIDQGLDTGPIIYQKLISFDSNENTFLQTYKRLNIEIEKLFIDNIEKIISKNFSVFPQLKIGTYHRISDLPKEFSGWDSNIQSEIIRLNSLLNNN